MIRLERYLFRNAAGGFLMVLLALTGVIWVTQALSKLSLVTSKGQTVLVFLELTLQSLPLMIMQISPFALFIATLFTLNKMNSDSELVVMNAAGMPPWRILKPFLILACLVAMLVALMTTVVMPIAARRTLELVNLIRTDMVTRIIASGEFISLDEGITFHYREKQGDVMLGLMIQDRRDPAKISTYLAERGQMTDTSSGSFMVLERGSIHRQSPEQKDNAIIAFQNYAIDMAQLGGDKEGRSILKPVERSTYDLLFPPKDDEGARLFAGRMRAELHQRFTSPLMVFAAMAIAFATLGAPRTTRQGLGLTILYANLVMGGTRVASFAAFTMVQSSAMAVPLFYGIPLGTVLVSALLFMSKNGLFRKEPKRSTLSFAGKAA